MRASTRPGRRRGWSLDFAASHLIHLRAPGAVEKTRLVFVSDTHLGREDERDAAYRENSRRMAGAYQTTRHQRTGEHSSPEALFLETLGHAREVQADLVVVGGDLLSFPSLAAVEWAHARLDETGIPWLYVAGNHDWHYEGMAGSSAELRAWGERRLAPLYRGRDPLTGTYDFNGLRLVLVDNATYEISAEQLEFYRKAVAVDQPVILVCHIPLYVPGRDVKYGCGHPDWGAATDRNYLIERRPKWPEEGHTRITMEFHREVFATENLLAVLSGHTHRPAVDVHKGIPVFVAPANASGGFLQISIGPTS